MKPTKAIAFLMAAAMAFSATAADLSPILTIGKKWEVKHAYYDAADPNPNSRVYDDPWTFEVVGDTLVNDQAAKVVAITSRPDTDLNGNTPGHYRNSWYEEDGMVYSQYINANNEFRLQYNLTLADGQTGFYGYSYVSATSVNLCGQQSKVIALGASAALISDYWVEGIGPICGIILHMSPSIPSMIPQRYYLQERYVTAVYDGDEKIFDLDEFNSAMGIHLAGIEKIENDGADDSNAPVEYFNLQGMKVNSPAAGQIVIKRQGSKVSKIAVK